MISWRSKRTVFLEGEIKFLSTEWVDYVEEPMKYQELRPHFFSVGGWCWEVGGGVVGGGVVYGCL